MPRRRWRGAEIGRLANGYAEKGLNQLVNDLGRSPDAISSLARRLGLRSPQRCHRQAMTRAARNTSVNIHFFDTPSEEVAEVLGYIWSRGDVEANARHVLRLRCPTSEEDGLLAVRGMLNSKHSIRRGQRYTVCEIWSYHLVQTLVQRYGRPARKDNPNPSLPNVPSSYAHALARGLLGSKTRCQETRITWTGPTRTMEALQTIIQAATGVPAPQKRSSRSKLHMSWENAGDVQILKAWLHL